MALASRPVSSRGDVWRRFWAKVDRSRSCWEWMASTTSGGYGQFVVDGDHWRAHRLAWTLTHGEIADGLLVLHRCDNRRCVRPSHLFLGTHTENMRDMHEKGRGVVPVGVPPDPRPGSLNPRARLTEALVVDIRRRYAVGGVSFRALAREYGVTKSTVHRAVAGQGWAHVESEAA